MLPVEDLNSKHQYNVFETFFCAEAAVLTVFNNILAPNLLAVDKSLHPKKTKYVIAW